MLMNSSENGHLSNKVSDMYTLVDSLKLLYSGLQSPYDREITGSKSESLSPCERSEYEG